MVVVVLAITPQMRNFNFRVRRLNGDFHAHVYQFDQKFLSSFAGRQTTDLCPFGRCQVLATSLKMMARCVLMKLTDGDLRTGLAPLYLVPRHPKHDRRRA